MPKVPGGPRRAWLQIHPPAAAISELLSSCQPVLDRLKHGQPSMVKTFLVHESWNLVHLQGQVCVATFKTYVKHSGTPRFSEEDAVCSTLPALDSSPFALRRLPMPSRLESALNTTFASDILSHLFEKLVAEFWLQRKKPGSNEVPYLFVNHQAQKTRRILCPSLMLPGAFTGVWTPNESLRPHTAGPASNRCAQVPRVIWLPSSCGTSAHCTSFRAGTMGRGLSQVERFSTVFGDWSFFFGNVQSTSNEGFIRRSTEWVMSWYSVGFLRSSSLVWQKQEATMEWWSATRFRCLGWPFWAK